MLTTFPTFAIFHWKFKKYSFKIIYAITDWVFGISKIMHCGILINMPYCTYLQPTNTKTLCYINTINVSYRPAALWRYLSRYDNGIERPDISKYLLCGDFVPNYSLLSSRLTKTAKMIAFWIILHETLCLLAPTGGLRWLYRFPMIILYFTGLEDTPLVEGEHILQWRWKHHILKYGEKYRRELYELPKSFCNKQIARFNDKFCR